jgi:hypothetical protein
MLYLALAPPIFGKLFAAAGKSEKSSTATMRGARSSANKISVLLGAIEMMRCGGVVIVTLRPAVSVIVPPAIAVGGASVDAAVGTLAVGGAAVGGITVGAAVVGAVVTAGVLLDPQALKSSVRISASAGAYRRKNIFTPTY